MMEKARNLLIRILFRLLDVGGTNFEETDKEVIRWLATSSKDIGCIRYVQMRERALVRGILDSGLLNSPRDSFVRQQGQRFEIHAFQTKTLKAQEMINRRNAAIQKEVEQN